MSQRQLSRPKQSAAEGSCITKVDWLRVEISRLHSATLEMTGIGERYPDRTK